MGRILRAFIWLRWRVLVNSLERTGARDTLERFSVAVEKLGPIIALVLLIPSAIGLAVLGMVAGFGLASGSWLLPFEIVRFFLLAALAFTILGPIMLPTRDGGNTVRFLLLPISRPTLYVAHVAGALADPWILLLVPLLLAVPFGMTVAGHPIAALLALIAGAALLTLVTGLTSLTSALIHLLLRNRRRSDFVMLFLVLVLPLVGLLPSLLHAQRHREGTRPAREHGAPSVVAVAARHVFPYVPSELYRRTARAAIAAPARSARPLIALAAIALAIQGLAYGAFLKMLDMPVSLGARRAGSFGGLWNQKIPGLTPGASAVAFTQLRLALRTPRGRSIIAGPLLMLAAFGAMNYGRGAFGIGAFTLDTGLSLAVAGCFVSLLSVLPLAMNQFAVDRAGFTRQMLSPLGIGELLAGKAVGNALIAGIPAVCCFVLPALVFPGGDPFLWLALPFGLLATFVLVSPVAAALSAMFPRTVDLSSIGHGSNAHQAAGLLGMLSYVVASAPAVGVVLLGTRFLHRPPLVPFFMLIWCALALAVSWMLFVPVRRLVASRCENLAQHY